MAAGTRSSSTRRCGRALSVATSTGAGPRVSAQVEKRRAAAVSRCSNSTTSMTCCLYWSTARYRYLQRPAISTQVSSTNHRSPMACRSGQAAPTVTGPPTVPTDHGRDQHAGRRRWVMPPAGAPLVSRQRRPPWLARRAARRSPRRTRRH